MTISLFESNSFYKNHYIFGLNQNLQSALPNLSGLGRPFFYFVLFVFVAVVVVVVCLFVCFFFIVSILVYFDARSNMIHHHFACISHF